MTNICLIIIILFAIILISKLNYITNICLMENMENSNKLQILEIKDSLFELIKNSNSNEIVKNISENMFGSTMHHHYHILYDIRTLLGNDKKIYTEIGSYNGGSMCLMLSHNYNTEINCIDPFHLERSNRTIIEKNIKKYNTNNYKVNIYQNFSTDQKLLDQLNNNNFKTDILFIDGDHSYDGVIKDFYNFEKFVNSNGYIIFDDYEDWQSSPNVRVAVNDIVKNLDYNKYKVIGNFDNIKNAYDSLNCKQSNDFILYKI